MDEQFRSPPEGPPTAPEGPSTPLTPEEKDIRNWAMLMHLAALSVFITGVGLLIGPLIVWLIKRQDSPFIDEHGKESVNFQISVFIYQLALAAIGAATCGIGFLVAGPLMLALFVTDIVLVVLASIKASNGEWYRYPMTIRFVK